MTNLSDFGGGVTDLAEDDDTAEEKSGYGHDREYRKGRCRAISRSTNRRCRSPAGHGVDDNYCANGSHNRPDGPLLSIELEDAVDRTELMIRESDNDDLDADLVRLALHAAVGIEDQPLTVTEEEGLWLPARFGDVGRLIVRSPVSTHDYRCEDGIGRSVETVRPGHWDPDYLDGAGRTARIRNEECLPGDDGQPQVGLLVPGGQQHWFPVEFPRRDDS